jgi:ribulose-5-phosphate 4-epimerase/fuculose-1-phosphate aldolase
MMSKTTGPVSIKETVSASEWQMRVDLAAFYRIVARNGWDDLLLAHISARLPDEEAYLINPFGLLFEEITASSLLKVDYEGKKLLPDDYDISPEANVIHGNILLGRPDVICAAHVHTTAGTAVSSQEGGLLNITQQTMIIGGRLGYHDYQGIVFDPAEGPSLQASLADNLYVILRNHGLLTVGSSVAQAYFGLYNLQRACETQVAAQTGGATIPVSEAAIERSSPLLNMMNNIPVGVLPPMLDLLWKAELRKLRRNEPDFEI